MRRRLVVGVFTALASAASFGGCTAIQSLGYDLPTDAPEADASIARDAPSASDGGAPVRVAALAPGLGFHACAWLTDGTLKCWGKNDYGQLGLGDTSNRGDEPDEMGANLPRIDLGQGTTVKAVAVGVRHTCAIVDDGRVKCWGKNDSGQLGLGDTLARGDAPGEMGDALPYVDLGNGKTALSITAGQDFTCAVLDDRSIRCWGDNRRGQLGLGDTKRRGTAPGQMGASLPSVDVAASSVSQLTSGAAHTCAILNTGRVKCWGDNISGQLGLGDRLRRGDDPGEMGASLPAIQFAPETVPSALSAGSDMTCAVFADKAARCWGLNTAGQAGIGNDSYDPGSARGDIAALAAVDLGPNRRAALISGGGGHNCALLDDGDVKCWGFNGSGQLGTGDTRARGASPSDMGDALPSVAFGKRRALSVASGAEHTCALLDDNSVECWGANAEGQLGQGDRLNRGDLPNVVGMLAPVALVK